MATTYKTLTLKSATPGKGSNLCAQNGTLTTVIDGGAGIITYKLDTYPATYTGVKSQESNIFTGLTTGDYKVSVTDGCGSVAYSSKVTVTSDNAPLEVGLLAIAHNIAKKVA